MRLLLLYPQIASRPCTECQRWWYDHEGNVLMRGGKPQPRPAGSKTPCGTCPKVPPKTESPSADKAIELTDDHRQTYRFYRECRAVGQFPDDPLVRWAAAVIRGVEDHCEKVLAGRTQLTLLSAVKGFA